MARRYAIYFAPDPGSALWRFGSACLGYDAASGLEVEQQAPGGFTPAEWHAATADPRKYGFHATLKAPFSLADGASEDALVAAAERIAAGLAPADLGACAVGIIPAETGGGFIAITPASPPPALGVLERAVVEGFEPFRAPIEPADRARRRPDRLSERQRAYLERYGYPYVLEEFGFHMTLTGRLGDPERAVGFLRDQAERSGVAGELSVDRLAVFRQEGEGKRFAVLSVHPLVLPNQGSHASAPVGAVGSAT